MGIAGTKRGDTARRIYAVLKRNPGLTRAEVAAYMPDLTPNAVACMMSKMKKEGAVEVRGRKMIRPDATAGSKTAPIYHVKYKSGAVPTKPKVKPKPKAPKVRRVVEAPKPVVNTKPAWSVADIKPEPEGPKTPVAEREVLVLRHLTDIYEAMNLMTDQQDALIAILKDTLLQLNATERELDRERQRRNWWDKVKELF